MSDIAQSAPSTSNGRWLGLWIVVGAIVITAIFTQDISRASRLATEIEVGLCWINSWFLRDLRTPFGGSKQSGIGREGGVHSLEFYTELRNVMIKY